MEMDVFTINQSSCSTEIPHELRTGHAFPYLPISLTAGQLPLVQVCNILTCGTMIGGRIHPNLDCTSAYGILTSGNTAGSAYAAKKPCIRPEHKEEISAEASMSPDSGLVSSVDWRGVFIGWKSGRVISYGSPGSPLCSCLFVVLAQF